MEGEINTKFFTTQHDMFASGLVAEIGVNAFVVWSAIKYHADLGTGEAHPGMRRIGELTGLGKSTVQRAIVILSAANLVRVLEAAKFKRSGPTYLARERLTLRLAGQVICVVVIDYVPSKLKSRLARLTQCLSTGESDPGAWAEVDIIPGPGFHWDPVRGMLRAKIEAQKLSRKAEESDLDEGGVAFLERFAPSLLAGKQ